ncbi:MAG: ATP-dependent DNA helicase RecG [Calditrichaeota bacterium]|nr:ATP-dependent DNA helicase RecG [Calditrichota bacterium]HQU72091.1 ATP-dependent DNA helicase RecG [Calditrichia bacterium]
MSENRPDILDTEVMFLKGVGPRRAEVLNEMGIFSLLDMLEYRPRRYLDRSELRRIGEVDVDAEATIIGEILSVRLHRRGRRRLVVRVNDTTGVLEATWFNHAEGFSRMFKAGQMVAVSGKVSFYRAWQMVHPDFDILSENREQLNTGQLIPLYPSTQELKKVGLGHVALRRIFHEALKRYGEQIPENLPGDRVKRYKLLSRRETFHQLHFPESREQIEQCWRRLKYEELFFLQLLIALRRHFELQPIAGKKVALAAEKVGEMTRHLPFTLTGAQTRVVEEIRRDMSGGRVMNRLVQGDVGSGKTVVGLLAMRMAIAAGYQAALMAPTEILAQQHYFNIEAFVQASGIRTLLLTGSMKASEKKAAQQAISAGQVDLVVGTHALIQEGVDFSRLGLAVIDEQHRFGVLQRQALISKGGSPHVLVMTATPIPRTLALTIYGDLDVSVIDELPPGRQPVQTHWRTEERLPMVFDFIRDHIGRGEQAYIVYPLIESSEKIDLKAATEHYDYFCKSVFADYRLLLLHGRMSMAEKEQVMGAFKSGKADILVATTVIEVGVDVPNATIMLIEHAERFGLSQLHQLRGRVGRGGRRSHCILSTPPALNEVAQQRMMIMEKTNDGFVIAEEDLRLRGSGEFFGTRQHGLPDLRYADLVSDQKIVQVAREDAFAVVEGDPHLRGVGHQGVRRHFQSRYRERFQLPGIA